MTVEDVIMGCSTPEGATGFLIGRQIAPRAGLPVSTAGVTVTGMGAAAVFEVI
jgi:acetyl-CoA C-acetyltransferase